MHVLLVGATGFIGSAILARLLVEGHSVTGVGRGAPPRAFPDVRWVRLDMRDALTPGVWLPHLADVDCVVNCVGVLQDNAQNSTQDAHKGAPSALFEACVAAGVRRVIHFSAIGVDRETPSDFSRSKAEGDAALRQTSLDWVILRPSVVVGRTAFGGSALFRGLAGLPVLPRFSQAGLLQIVQLDDVVETALFFLDPAAPARLSLELAGPDRLSFDDVVAQYRRWLGWRPARQVYAPGWLLRGGYLLGDVVGALGWRPPIRSTAAKEIPRGAIGDNGPWTEVTHIRPQSLRDALARQPAGVQERWFARLYALKPLVFAIFSSFWITTAFMSLGPGWDIGVNLMREGGASGLAAPLTVVAGALCDLVIGVGIAFRRTARSALIAALCLSLVYAVIGTWLVPRLWIDPLAPMLKILPILALNLVALAILDDR